MTEPLVVRREVQIAAPPATIFAFLTDPDKILRWLGTDATMEPHAGGLYLVNVGGKHTARGQFTPTGTGAVGYRYFPTNDAGGGGRWDPMSMLFFVPAASVEVNVGAKSRAR